MTARDSRGRFIKALPPLHLQPGQLVRAPELETQGPPIWLSLILVCGAAILIIFILMAMAR